MCARLIGVVLAIVLSIGCSRTMPAPTNISALTATDLGTLPYSGSQDVRDSGTTFTVWYKYTPVTSQMISVFGFGDLVTYRPTVTVFTGTGSTPVGIGVTNKAIQVYVNSGQTYWFRFLRNSSAASPAVLLIEAEAFTPEAIPPGAILVNDDTDGAPGAIVSSIDGDDYHVYDYVSPFPAGESGDVLRATGLVLMEDQTGGLKRYDADLSLLGSVAFTMNGSTDKLRANQTLNQWFASNSGAGATPAKVQVVNSDGSLGTLHTLPLAGLTALTASNDGSIIYNAGQSSSISAPIKRWLTGSSAMGTDLVAGVSGYIVTSMMTLEDDSIVALYSESAAPHNTYAVRYDSTGATVQTYSIASTATSLAPRLTHSMTPATSFWVWFHETSGISTFREYAIGGSVLRSVNHIDFSNGGYAPAETPTPTALFGVSPSCPFLVLGAATGTIQVVKATVPGGSDREFDFTAGGGLSPATFSLSDGETQEFTVSAGDGYSVAETPEAGWSTSFVVSNGSPPDNISVGSGETVVVTVTNTQGPPPVPPTEGNDCCASSGPGGGSPGGGGGGYPPGTLPPRVVPPGGAPPEYIACNAGGGLPAFAVDPADLSDLASCTIPRVYLQWRLRDGSVLRFGQFDFTSYHGPVTARVKKWGPVRQVLADRFGSFQVNHFTIQLSDTDRAIRGLLTSAATKYIDGTEIEVLVEADGGPPLVLARAVVSDYSFNTDLSIDLTCTDPLGYKYSSVSLDRPIPRRTFRRELFPALPEESSGKPVPIGYGIYSDDYTWLLNPNRIPVGIIPIHYVGAPSSIPGLEGAPGDHAFAVFGHALSCTQSVFASNLGKDVDGVTDVSYGSVRMPSSLFGSEFFVPGIDLPKYHDLTGTDGITERFCFLTVKEGARVRDHLNGRVPITINALGIEDVGDGTGNTITSLTYQFLHFLCQWVLQDYRTGPWLPVPTFADGTPKVRTSSFQSVVAIQTARMGEPYNGAMYLGAHKSGRTWNTAWQVSGDMRHGVNHQGQSLVETLNDTGSTVALTTFADTDDVIADSFVVEPKPEEIANSLTYEAGPEAATNRVAVVAKTIRNLTSIANHDDREAQALTYEATRHPPTADDVANRTLVRTADAPTEVRFALNLRGAALRLGQLIRITHYQGIGPFGWTDRVLLVTGVQTMPDADQFACEVECEDVHDVLAAGADVFMIDEALIDEARIG